MQKYTITFEYKAERGTKFWAVTEVGGDTHYGCGDSFEEAQEGLIRGLKRLETIPEIPAPITIEI